MVDGDSFSTWEDMRGHADRSGSLAHASARTQTSSVSARPDKRSDPSAERK